VLGTLNVWEHFHQVKPTMGNVFIVDFRRNQCLSKILPTFSTMSQNKSGLCWKGGRHVYIVF
jgi:hypothetical protein